MKSKKVNHSKGFTIIETLIVLAIAATIFLVVFLAVSALDRSSRNTARKDDAAAILAAVGDFAGDNNGSLPTTIAAAGPPSYTISGGAGTVQVSVKLSHYTDSTGTAKVSFNATGSGGTLTANTDMLVVEENATCASSSTVSGTATTGAYAVLFAIESGSGYVPQCLGS